MTSFYSFFNQLFGVVFAPKVQKAIEKIILLLAALGFLIHLG
jgi:hypothetical protein